MSMLKTLWGVAAKRFELGKQGDKIFLQGQSGVN
jgi:hypothetical protein